MSYNLTESRISDAGNILYPPSAYTSATQSQKKRLVQDNIQFGKQQQAAKSDAAANMATSYGRAALPAPGGFSKPNDLRLLTLAFIAAFNAMSKSVITQTNDFAQMQQLDETQTQTVLESTTNAINKQEAAEQESAQIANYEKSTAASEKIFGWVMFGVGIALMLGTLLSGFVTGGTTEAALPEEAEMIDLASTDGEHVGDAGDGEELDILNDSSDLNDNASEGNETEQNNNDYMQRTQDMMSKPTAELNTAEEDTEETVTRDLDKSSKAAEKTGSSWGKRLGKILLKMTMAAALGSPMLMKGLASISVADQLDQLAAAQKSVGQALAVMQSNNMYLQFLQQLVQREGSVLQDETSAASQVIETYGDITSAYQGISYGLARAV